MAFVVTNRIPVARDHEKDFEDRFRKRAQSQPTRLEIKGSSNHGSARWVTSNDAPRRMPSLS